MILRAAFLVTRSDTIGGSHIHIRDLGISLIRDGHDVVIFIGGTGPIVSFFESYGFNVVVIQDLKRNISPINDLKAYFAIRKKLREINPDLVSTHSSKAGFLGRLAARSLKIPVIFTAHGWSFTSGKSKMSILLYKYLERLVRPATDFFITVSDYDRDLAKNKIGVSSNKITTIHNGMVDIEKKYFANPGETNTVNIIMVARFDQQKNHSDLIHAISGFKNVKLHLIGDGPKLQNVMDLVESLGITNIVKFYGRVDNVHEILALCQIFTLISNWEGFPRSTVEAMRAGLPVIVSDVGGAAEAITHNKNGFVVKKNDRKALKHYLDKLINDYELRIKMGNASRNAYEDNLKFERMYYETLDVYKKILKN